MAKRVIILGASTNPERASYEATQLLVNGGYEALPIGIKKGDIAGVEISQDKVYPRPLYAITLYLSPDNQKEYYPYIVSALPQKLIFNPGTENPELAKLAEAHGIETMEACTLVMLKTGQF